ncbi:MAG: stage II sporulation protein D [Flavobacteriales bacterium]|jgi:stage II sporulation protein D
MGSTQTVRIGIWRDNNRTDRFYFMTLDESVWMADNSKITIPANKTLYFTSKDGKIRLSTAEKVYGLYNTVRSISEGNYHLLSLKPSRTEQIYNGFIEVDTDTLGLQVVNCFKDIDNYISGVVEAETGKEQNKEFYKAQATISRTFAMSNSRRHEAEGFNLCDQVHCQVYHGVSRFNPDIKLATEETAGEVIVDPEINLITASFHSNCGGITTNSEDVWSKSLPYLRSITDTFCVSGVHYSWDHHIDSEKWLNHLSKQYAMSITDFERSDLLQFESTSRERFLQFNSTRIERKEIRSKWDLKSTFFDSTIKGDEIILNGRGHGHGVGLCQEGAMEMSRIGYKYAEILQFYYTDVHLIHKTMMDFFKDGQ